MTYIESPSARPDISIYVESDDVSKLYLNGDLVYVNLWTEWRGINTVAGIKFKKGWNTVVFKVFNATGEWEGLLRLADSDGRPLEGLRITNQRPESL